MRWAALVILAGLLAVMYGETLGYMVHIWTVDDNYGHGFFVPVISGYLAWNLRGTVGHLPLQGSWWSLPLVGAALVLYFIGELTTLHVVLHLSFWLLLVGLIAAAVGFPVVRALAFPLGYLLTAVPLPQFLYQGLSGQLQLISSALGVGCLQVIGVTAFREGNVIDLGPIQLQVVEACSGLRYMFPLASLALLCAYLFKDRLWKRVVLVLSSIPISIFLNGFRIGVIGVLVDAYGEGAAEGFAHFFEGWIIFVVSLGLLFLETWGLARLGSAPGSRRTWADVFECNLGPASAEGMQDRTPQPEPASTWRLAPTFLLCLVLLIPTALASAQGLGKDEEVPPVRHVFLDFPLELGEWTGVPLTLDRIYTEALKFDDYVLADYRETRKTGAAPVNFYAAYYRSQKKGQSAHSPRTCIPGGGWEITGLDPMDLGGGPGGPPRITVNRVRIQKGDDRQVVLYWFQQRGRTIANEYLVKWYLLWDALVMRRTDGALVRLTSPVMPGEDERAAEARLVAFAETVRPELNKYVPD